MSTSAKRLLAHDSEALQSLSNRIESLERALVGAAALGPDGTATATTAALMDTNLLTRLHQAQMRLNVAVQQAPEVGDALELFPVALPKLFRHAKSPYQAAHFYSREAMTAAIGPAAAVPVTAKMAIIESAEQDVKATFSDLLKIDAANEGLSPDSFREMGKCIGEYTAVEAAAHDQAAAVAQLSARVTAIMESYGAYVDCLSDAFVQLDEAIRDAEKKVVEVERARRKQQDE
ncbi:hypothetical protein GGF31_001463 [Allomyces arbusculus]|nr:hypothetical protein GGF31_001463 [Allomyces arbusculus]